MQKQKLKTPPLRKSASRSRTKKPVSVKLVHEKRPLLKHFRLIEHKHTGSVLHVRHSSHLALFLILVFVGFFLVISQNLTVALPPAQTGTVTVGLVVTGPPTSDGALITSPVDGTAINNINPLNVSGTCVAASFVVVYNNGDLAGSTICTPSGTFALTVQLAIGNNILTALNFDSLNQAGPATPSITVIFKSEETLPEVVTPILPDNPVIIPGVTKSPSDCDQYEQNGKLEIGGEPRIAVVCVPRTVDANQDHKIGILVWGGQPPYAINFKWGSGDTTLVSMDAPGYRAVKLRYASSGVYNINIQLTDKTTKAATGTSAVEVTGGTSNEALVQALSGLVNTAWFETPVPLYVIALAMTLGFWGGDIFHRRVTSGPSPPTRSKTKRRA